MIIEIATNILHLFLFIMMSLVYLFLTLIIYAGIEDRELFKGKDFINIFIIWIAFLLTNILIIDIFEVLI